MAFPPFSLMKPIVACFDGILSPFDLWGPLRQILMASCLPRFDLLGPHRQILMAFWPLFTDEAHCGKGPKGRDYVLVFVIHGVMHVLLRY